MFASVAPAKDAGVTVWVVTGEALSVLQIDASGRRIVTTRRLTTEAEKRLAATRSGILRGGRQSLRQAFLALAAEGRVGGPIKIIPMSRRGRPFAEITLAGPKLREVVAIPLD